MFHHYLVTRFNLRNPKWDVTKNNELLLTDEWMEHRIGLFSSFCLPSVAAQKNQNFTWLIFFDTNTKPEFRSRIEALLDGHQNFRAMYIEGMNAFYPELKKLLLEEAGSPYLITSRIDNDDCISNRFIDEVQKNFNSQDYQAIDIVDGYTLGIKPDVMLGKKEHIFNPFISLIEKNDDPKTVWLSDHNMWKKETRIKSIRGNRRWLSIIHEKNKVNEFDGYGNVDWQVIRNEFVVSQEMDSYISTHIIPHEKWRYLSLKNYVYVKWVLMNKLLKKSLGIYKLKK